MNDGTDVTVRVIEASDAIAVSELLGQLGYPVAAGQLHNRIHRFDAAPSAEAVVAVADDARVIGLASLHRLSLLTDDAPLAFLTSLVVAEDYRGRGIGQRLVEHVSRRARELGCTRIAVTTHLRRAGAHAFYERLGFEFTGRRYVRALDPL